MDTRAKCSDTEYNGVRWNCGSPGEWRPLGVAVPNQNVGKQIKTVSELKQIPGRAGEEKCYPSPQFLATPLNRWTSKPVSTCIYTLIIFFVDSKCTYTILHR